MGDVFRETRTLTLTARKKVRIPTETGGARYEWQGTARQYSAYMEIDVRSIMQELATRAANSKSRRARFMKGRLVVKVTPLD